MIAHRSSASDGVQDAAAMGILEYFGFDIYVDIPDAIEDMKCYPVHERDERVAIEIREAFFRSGKESPEYMVGSAPQPRHDVDLPGLDLMPLQNEHYGYTEKRRVEDRNKCDHNGVLYHANQLSSILNLEKRVTAIFSPNFCTAVSIRPWIVTSGFFMNG